MKVALVTGSSRGIGAAIAKTLSRDGFQVAIQYRSGEKEAKILAAELPGSKVFECDLSKSEACLDLAKKVAADMGPIAVLVNNAGITADQILAFAKPEDFDQLISTNLKPVFLLSKTISRQMMRQKWGRIINITSVVGHTGNPGQSIYTATKAAINAFTKTIAMELAPVGILCNCVAPGFIETEMTAQLTETTKEFILAKIPMKRMGSVMEVAEAVAFLASEKSSYITGSTIHVNGGMYTS